MLLAVTVVAFWANSVRRQRDALAAIVASVRRSGGYADLHYSYEAVEPGQNPQHAFYRAEFDPTKKSWLPAAIVSRSGADFFHNVVAISYGSNSPQTRTY
jgi:hypothetical protein